jgi:hypothetical protein
MIRIILNDDKTPEAYNFGNKKPRFLTEAGLLIREQITV